MLEPGEIFLEKYQLERVLGQGGYATVFRARHIDSHEVFALKLLHLDDAVARRRFHLEARLASELEHPGFVTLHSFGEVGELQYMLLEFIDGLTLRESVLRDGPFTPSQTISLARQLANALVAAHELGVLHRDIKPENIMITGPRAQLRVKLLDLGVAKLVAEDGPITISAPLTTIGRVVGTPRYLAPELLLGEAPTAAADVFSVGLVMYEALVGRRAIEHEDVEDVIDEMLNAREFSVPGAVDVPDELRGVISRSLAKKRVDRFATAHQLQDALDALDDASETAVIGPAELAMLRADQEAPLDTARTIIDQPCESPKALIETHPSATPADVNAAVVRLREDAQGRSRNEAPRPRPATRRRPAPELGLELDYEPPPQVSPTELDPSPKWQNYIGWVVLGVALFVAFGEVTGLFGVRTTVFEGHPLLCGWGNVATVTTRQLHVVDFALNLHETVSCSPAQ